MADGLVFFWANLKHYALALPGLRLRFMPNTPEIGNFFFPAIIQTVLEYRAYVLVIPFCCAVALLPFWTVCAIFGFWAVRTAARWTTFITPYIFWSHIWAESDHPRIRLHFTQELMLEIERRFKNGLPFEHLQKLAMTLMDETCQEGNQHAR